MHPPNRDFRDSPRGFSSNLATKVIGCLIAFAMLTYGSRDGLAAIASESPPVVAETASGQPDSNLPLANSETLPYGKPPQDRQDPTKDKVPAPESSGTSPFETLKLVLEGNALGANLTRDGVTQAIRKYRAAFEIFKSQGSKLGMAGALFACGTAHFFLGQHREALEALLESSDYFKESGFDLMRPILDATIGSSYAELGETTKALEWLNRALPAVRRLNNPQLLAMTLSGLGIVSARLGQKQKAIEYLGQALDLYGKSGNRWLEFQVLIAVSVATNLIGKSQQAMVAATRALEIAKELGNREGEGFSHFVIGAIYDSLGDQQRAFEEYTQALHLFEQEDHKVGQALAYGNLASVYVARGEIDKALACLTRSREYGKESPEPELLGNIFGSLGAISEVRADPVSALRYYQKALALVRDKRDQRLEATVLLSISEIYHVFGDFERAVSQLQRAAAVFQELEDPVRQAVALDSLGLNYLALHRYEEAFDSLRQALEIQRRIDDRKGQTLTLRDMGVVYQVMEKPAEALKWYKEALLLMRQVNNTLDQIQLYQAMGGATYQATRDFGAASSLYLQALNLSRTAGFRLHEPFILADLGKLNEIVGNLTQAEDFYDQATAASELVRTSVRIEEFKTALASNSADMYARAVLLKFRLRKWSAAFELSERARARTFLDQMNNVHLDVKRGADLELLNQEQSLRFDIRLLDLKLRQAMINNPSSEAEGLLRERLQAKQKDYANLLIHLKASNPDYAELQSYIPRPLNEIQGLLGPQTTLLSYYVTAEKTLAFVVGSSSFQVVEISVKEADLRGAINWFRDFASLRNPQPESLKQFHAWLIAPIRQFIKTDQVIIVPHGILHYVPFAALTDGRRYFGDEHAITYLPSAATLPTLRRRIPHGGQRMLAVAQAQAPGLALLHYTNEEATSVAKLYGALPMLTGRATRAEFLKRASTANVLHLAAHAELNATSPLFSRIRLAPASDDSGAIEVREIYGMDLTRTNLVALSACETQLGAQSKGDDIIGLNRAFIYAGAAAVIASLWTVDDKATSVLMKSFYGHLKQGMSKAAALQAAQAATRKQYPHPYYWAAFVLTGDPGKPRRR